MLKKQNEIQEHLIDKRADFEDDHNRNFKQDEQDEKKDEAALVDLFDSNDF